MCFWVDAMPTSAVWKSANMYSAQGASGHALLVDLVNVLAHSKVQGVQRFGLLCTHANKG
jgi:hypothetical protein